MEDSDETNSEAGESSPTSSSPSDTNPLRGPSALRKRMRQLVRPLYERRWGNADMVWNSTRSLLCREDAVAEGETYKALSSAKREELADALFNQAYSCLMAMTLWGGEGGVERTHAALRQNPLLANSLWCACRIRWHAQLKVPLAEFRKLMRSPHAIAELPPGETPLEEALPADSERGAGTDREDHDLHYHNAEARELTADHELPGQRGDQGDGGGDRDPPGQESRRAGNNDRATRDTTGGDNQARGLA